MLLGSMQEMLILRVTDLVVRSIWRGICWSSVFARHNTCL